MRTAATLAMAIILGATLAAGVNSAQEMPGMQHEHGGILPLTPVYPRMGRAQEHPSGALFTLEEAQRIAAETNPTLRQAETEIRVAKARQQQAGLYPNPTIAYTGDEIRGGSTGGGKQGFFVQQDIVTGGKLSKSREVFAKEISRAQIAAEKQKLRVETAVKSAYMRVLAAQELLDVRLGLAQIAQDDAETRGRLLNTGQADGTEVLQAEIDAQRARLAARMQENNLREEWRSLGAVLGRPDLPVTIVTGDLEHNWPELNEDQIGEKIAAQSPATRIAETDVQRAEAEIARAKRESIPDLQLLGGLEYNNELLSSVPYAKGWEGIVEVAVQVPLFNRNQGNVAAAGAERDRAQLEKQRVALALRERASNILDQYANAQLMAVEYRDSILPRAKKAYSLMLENYGQMLAAYPRVIETQRKLFEMQAEYISALEGVWTTGITLQGFLLTDGLEAPARYGEAGRPVRETNVPSSDHTLAPAETMPRP
ncbi:MAG TPA: TolC family protein [Candidatus Acidoferrum sp.]|nr:TolC family protein [Candidatus Acidoferrum sp.]